MEKLRIGVIGTGNISNCHMEGYTAISDLVEVVACCDLDRKKMDAWAERWGVPNKYTDYNEMLAKENLHAVSVCTWNAAHKAPTVAALKAGCNVICEKPMAMNAGEAEEMLAAAKESGKILQIGFVRRFGADADHIKELTASGVMGDIYYAKATYLRKNGCPGGWFADKRFSGGGPLIDLGVHVIDLSRYLAGSPKPVSVFGVTYNNLGPDRAKGVGSIWDADLKESIYEVSTEDMASAMVRFDNGFTLYVEASFNLNIKEDCGRVELFGTKAGAKLEGPLEVYTDLGGFFANCQIQGKTYFDMDAFKDEIAGFVNATIGKCECRATGEDGLALMKILDAIYESAETGKSVDIQW